MGFPVKVQFKVYFPRKAKKIEHTYTEKEIESKSNWHFSFIFVSLKKYNGCLFSELYTLRT